MDREVRPRDARPSVKAPLIGCARLGERAVDELGSARDIAGRDAAADLVEAVEMERTLADSLRKRGYVVYGGH